LDRRMLSWHMRTSGDHICPAPDAARARESYTGSAAPLNSARPSHTELPVGGALIYHLCRHGAAPSLYALHSSPSDCASVSLYLDFARYSARSDWCLLCKRCFSHSARRWQSLHRASSLDQHCSLQTRFEHAVQCSMSTPCRPHPQHPFQRCAISSSLSSAGSRRGGLSPPVALLSRRCLLLRLSCSAAGTVLMSAGRSGS